MVLVTSMCFKMFIVSVALQTQQKSEKSINICKADRK